MIQLEKSSSFTKLDDNDIHLKFLVNLPVEIEGLGKIHSPNIKEAISMSESKYNLSLSCLLLDKSSIEQDMGDYSNYQIVLQQLYHDKYFRELFINGLNLHFDTKATWHQDDEYAFIYFNELSNESILTEEKFNYMQHIIKIANNIETKKEEYIAANSAAQKLIEKIKKNKKTAPPTSKINLHSIISSVLWKNHSFNIINQLNIYQLYDAYLRTVEIDNYHYTMTGIYAGTIDSKGIKMPDIFWANKIN